MKLAISLATLSLASGGAAFAPIAAPAKSFAQLKAYSDPSFAGGLPGALPPAGNFDPFGLLDNASPNEIKRFREAEVTHGRVAMLAVVGFLVGEAVVGQTPLFDYNVFGPAIIHFQQVPSPFWEILTLAIAFCEFYRARVGWEKPVDTANWFQLRDDYYPGDIGFDPLGLKPSDPEDFDIMQTKELQHGRLAMLGAAGIVAQELVDFKGIADHWNAA